MSSECLHWTSCFEIVESLGKYTLVIWLALVINQNLEVLAIFFKVLCLQLLSFFVLAQELLCLLPLLVSIFKQFVGNTFLLNTKLFKAPLLNRLLKDLSEVLGLGSKQKANHFIALCSRKTFVFKVILVFPCQNS